MSPLLVTACIGVATTVGVRAISGLWFTPCFWYWVGWCLGLIGNELAVLDGTFSPLSSFGGQLILKAHLGAAAGFLASTFLVTIVRGRVKLKFPASFRLPRIFWWALAVNFISGLAILAYAIIRVSPSSLLDFRAFRDAYIADTYNVSKLPTYMFILNLYGSFLTVATPVFLAFRDVVNGKVNKLQLTLCFLSGAPAGLASGGRGWLLGIVFPYLFVLLSLSEACHKRRRIEFAFGYFFFFFIFFCVAVSAIAFLRSDLRRAGEWSWTAFSPVYIYAGIPVAALTAYSEYAASQKPAWGGASFDFVARNLDRLGLPLMRDVSYLNYESRADVFRYGDPILASTHATYIPTLIQDVGLDLLWLGALLMCALLQGSAMWVRQHALASGVVSLWACYNGTFVFAQVAMAGSTGPFLGMLAALGFVWLFYSSYRPVGKHHAVLTRLRTFTHSSAESTGV